MAAYIPWGVTPWPGLEGQVVYFRTPAGLVMGRVDLPLSYEQEGLYGTATIVPPAVVGNDGNLYWVEWSLLENVGNPSPFSYRLLRADVTWDGSAPVPPVEVVSATASANPITGLRYLLAPAGENVLLFGPDFVANGAGEVVASGDNGIPGGGTMPSYGNYYQLLFADGTSRFAFTAFGS